MTAQKKPLKIQIKSFSCKILFEHKCIDNTLKKTLELAVKKRLDLKSADLRGADLRGANLYEAYLQEAHLMRADLREAHLRGADLRGTDFWEADLRGVDFSGACLWGAGLQGVDFSESFNLSEACLQEANFSGAYPWKTKDIKINTCMLNILRYQKGKLLAFKYLNGDKSPYQKKTYKIGKTYSEKKYDSDDKHPYGEGLSIATLEWCLKDAAFDLSKTYVEVEFNVKDIVAIPYASDGKFRVRKFRIVRKLSKKELQKFIK